MYGKKRKLPQRKSRHDDVLDAIEKQIKKLERLRTRHIFSIKKQVHEQFVKNGGCLPCGGRGWVVIPGLNSPRDDSFVDCPNVDCTPESRAQSGLDAVYTWYDTMKDTQDPCRDLYKILVTPIDSLIYELTQKIISEKMKRKKCRVVQNFLPLE